MKSNEQEVTKVLLADDHARVRAGIRKLLNSTDDIHVIGEASDGEEALRMAQELEPDVLLLDVEMPNMNGKEVAAVLTENQSPVRILALSAHDDSQYILGMLNNGASGYVMKEEVPEILVKAVRGVARGERDWVSRRVAKKLSRGTKPGSINREGFTLRELQILRGIVEGTPDQVLAEELNISERTVQNHIQTICSKARVKTRQELIEYTIQNKLT
jgi:two-component system, NarL family, response regulator DegU